MIVCRNMLPIRIPHCQNRPLDETRVMSMKLVLLLSALPLAAAEPLSYNCRWSEKSPAVDGDLTDSCWKDIPFADLARYRGGNPKAPDAGDTWRINCSRVEWKHRLEAGEYRRIPPHGAEIKDGDHPEDNWVWSPQGTINMHVPEQWGRLRFVN